MAIQNVVWDYLHGRESSPISTDVDVIWFDGERCTQKQDDALETLLRNVDPSVLWSVKNQARMHVLNGDDPYQSATDAMRYWPETASGSSKDIRERHMRNRCTVWA